MIKLMIEALAAILVLLTLEACATVCARTWETGTEVSHSALWGNSVSQHVTVGGDLGRDQCVTEKDDKSDRTDAGRP